MPNKREGGRVKKPRRVEIVPGETAGSASGAAHRTHRAESVAGTGRYEAKSASNAAAGTPVR